MREKERSKCSGNTGDSEEVLVRGSEESGRSVMINDVGKISRLGIMENFEGDDGYFEINALCNWKPLDNDDKIMMIR